MAAVSTADIMAVQMAATDSDAARPDGHREHRQGARLGGASDSLTPTSVMLVTPLWSRHGGVATHVQASAAALARSGIEVNVLAAQVDPGHDAPGVNVCHSPQLLSSSASMQERVGAALSRPPDVIHLHQLDDPEVVQALRTRAPVVVSAHGYTACPSGVYYFKPGEECTRSHGPGCVPNLLLRGCAHVRDPRPLPLAYRRAGRGLQALARADLAVAYSSAVDRHLAANGIARRTVVPLFTTLVAVRGAEHGARRRVVFAGRVVAAKGVGVLIRAARLVEGEFVICGEGWQLQAMRRLAARLGVAERVQFKGWLSADRLARELADAAVVAMPSVWPEPFGLVGIEGLAAGRPVVASATGGIEDWLQAGVDGIVVAPGDVNALADALEELLSDPRRRQAMGAAGRRSVAARFTPERHVQALLHAYARARATWETAGAPLAATAAR
jgi:glycosyltransferase involved in cell wall biosynthesis